MKWNESASGQIKIKVRRPRRTRPDLLFAIPAILYRVFFYPNTVQCTVHYYTSSYIWQTAKVAIVDYVYTHTQDMQKMAENARLVSPRTQ